MKISDLVIVFGTKTGMAKAVRKLTPQIISNWGKGSVPDAWEKPLRKAVIKRKDKIDKSFEELIK